METSNSFSRSSSLASNTGAGSNADAIAISPLGEITNSYDETFSPMATSSTGNAAAMSSFEELSAATSAKTPVDSQADMSKSSTETSTPTVFTTMSPSSSTSDSSSFTDTSGSGGSSSATATSPTGTSTSSDSRFVPGATSSTSTATATTSPTGVSTSAIVVTPAAPSDSLNPPPTPPSPSISNPPPTASPTSGVVVNGDRANNLIQGTSGNDTIFGRGGNDRLFGKQGDDLLFGGRGDDTLNGGEGDDVLNGGAGDDVLNGGAGADTLIGGRGADTFVLTSQAIVPARANIIVDFNMNQGDKIRVSKRIQISDIAFEVFDSNRNGSADATLIRLKTNNQILGIALNTVDTAGNTILNSQIFTST
jgi:serralysin